MSGGVAGARIERPPSKRANLSTVLVLLVPLAAAVAALAVGLILVAATGASISTAASAFALGAFGSDYAIGASLNRAAPLALVGLGFILASKANLTNIGAEGQIAMGGVFATAVAVPFAAVLPLGLGTALPLLAGGVAGAAWGGIAGFLKVRRGTNEVISTLLLSFVALNILYWCVTSTNLLRKPQTSASTQPESPMIPSSAMLPRLFEGSTSVLHVGLLIALGCAMIVGLALARGTFGLRLKAIGLNMQAARRAGINQSLQCVALALSGALGGVGGAIMLLGDQHVLKIGFSSNYGFDGIVVGLLARGSAFAVIVWALFFGFLRSGGITMEMMARVPFAVVWICQGLIVIAVAGSTAWVDHRAKAGMDRR